MKLFVTILAIALGLWSCATAAAATQDRRNPDQVSPVLAAQQDLRNADQVAPQRERTQDLRNPDRVGDPTRVTGAAAPASVVVAPTEAIPTADAGLSTLAMVLISIGGVLALAGAGYATMRVAHRHGHGHATA